MDLCELQNNCDIDITGNLGGGGAKYNRIGCESTNNLLLSGGGVQFFMRGQIKKVIRERGCSSV